MQPFFSDLPAITLASTVAANLINWLLHGVLTVQLYLYYLAFPTDRTWTKVAVYTVYILETTQTIGLGIILLMIIVGGSYNTDPRYLLGSHPWTNDEYKWSAQSLLTDIFACLVPVIAQCIYAHRIWIITQGKVIPCIIIALATFQPIAAGLTVTVNTNTSAMIVIGLWLGLTAVNDLIIAFVMVRSLSKDNFLSRYNRSRATRLVNLIIATGLLTIVANIIDIALLFIDIYIVGTWFGTAAFGIFMPKLYANSILVMLNNRMTIRNSQDVAPLNMASLNVVSTLVVADHEGPSDSTIPPGPGETTKKDK